MLKLCIKKVYKKCKEQQYFPKEKIINYVTEIYAPFTDDDISRKMAEMLTPPDTQAQIEIIYQTIEGFGLNQIKARINTMKGKFEIISKPKQGTTIKIIAPIEYKS